MRDQRTLNRADDRFCKNVVGHVLSKQLQVRLSRPLAVVPTSTGKPSAPRSSLPPTADTPEGCTRGSKLPPDPLASKQPRSNPRLASPSPTRASNCSDGSNTTSSFTRHRISSQTLPSTPCPACQSWRSSITYPQRKSSAKPLTLWPAVRHQGRTVFLQSSWNKKAHPPAVPAQAAVPMLGTRTHPPGHERCQHRHPLQEQRRPQRL